MIVATAQIYPKITKRGSGMRARWGMPLKLKIS